MAPALAHRARYAFAADNPAGPTDPIDPMVPRQFVTIGSTARPLALKSHTLPAVDSGAEGVPPDEANLVSSCATKSRGAGSPFCRLDHCGLKTRAHSRHILARFRLANLRICTGSGETVLKSWPGWGGALPRSWRGYGREVVRIRSGCSPVVVRI